MQREHQMNGLTPGEVSAPSSDETTFACLAHFLQLATWFIGPLVVYVMKRESRFVAFHSVQVLLWQAIWVGLSAVCFVALFVVMFASMPQSGGSGPTPHGPPAAFFLLIPLLWLVFMGSWALTLILSIVFGVKAARGEWAGYPIIGGWARRIVGI